MPTTKSIKLLPGETFILPPGATVTAVISVNSATATSICPLPAPSNYKCGYFKMVLDSDGAGHSMEPTEVFFRDVTVGTAVIDFDEVLDTGAGFVSIGTLNGHIPDTAVFQFLAYDTQTATDRFDYWLFFQVVEEYYDSLIMRLTNNGNNFYLKPADEYDCGGTFTDHPTIVVST